MAAMHKATCTRPGCGLACSSASVDEVMAWSEAHDQHCPSLKAQGIAPRLLADAERLGAVKALRKAAQDWVANADPDDADDLDALVARKLDERAAIIESGAVTL